MIKIEDSNENEMVLAFLKAEIDSPRFGLPIKSALSQLKYSREEIIDNADLNNLSHNIIRDKLMGFRGYKCNNALFAGFPNNVKWERFALAPMELNNLKYIKYNKWIEISGGSRLVVDGAKNIDTNQILEDDYNINEAIKTVAQEFKKGIRYPELIVAKGEDDFLVLIEGHTRATAYALANIKENIKIIVGTSSQMNNWIFY